MTARIVTGFDLDAVFASGPFQRAVDLYCYASLVFNCLCLELLFNRIIDHAT